jgi:hypothetical protein
MASNHSVADTNRAAWHCGELRSNAKDLATQFDGGQILNSRQRSSLAIVR